MDTNHFSSNTGNEGMEQRLWDYIDGDIPANEKNLVEELLLTDENWQSKYRELLDIQQMLKSAETEQPSMRFTKNVMEEIARYKIAPATRSYINKKIIYGITGFFLIILGAFMIYAFTQVNWSSEGSSSLPVDFSKVNLDWGKYINSTTLNIFFMLDAVIGLFLLDRYLTKRKQHIKEKQA
ncbi:MAG: hypothetical protein SFU87_15095 [Chitinophagaceae bacterium]|nr:hypothetical protein [Chitinophagaceae bacterium]